MHKFFHFGKTYDNEDKYLKLCVPKRTLTEARSHNPQFHHQVDACGQIVIKDEHFKNIGDVIPC